MLRSPGVSSRSMTAPNRRWFRYGLRTLFVVVTAVACWLAYELNWIYQRHKFLAEHGALHFGQRRTCCGFLANRPLATCS